MTTPRASKKAQAAAEASAALSGDASAGLGSNLDNDHVPDEFRISDLTEPVVTKPTDARKGVAEREVPPEHAVKLQDRIWIVLEDNDDIPPGGQFIGVDGAAFKLSPNIEAWVPIGICDVLDAAVKSVPVQDEITRQITGWKNRLRFPYRIVRNKPAPKGWVQPK